MYTPKPLFCYAFVSIRFCILFSSAPTSPPLTTSLSIVLICAHSLPIKTLFGSRTLLSPLPSSPPPLLSATGSYQKTITITKTGYLKHSPHTHARTHGNQRKTMARPARLIKQIQKRIQKNGLEQTQDAKKEEKNWRTKNAK
ncbi:hypothetical protein EDC01DRAFT_162352 [Geopyxis carbonaria]|nr:hypothetical protein EDC01DRAFT_162352 [Geopyxis carbonaria]